MCPYPQSSKQPLNTPSPLLSSHYFYHQFVKAKSLFCVYINAFSENIPRALPPGSTWHLLVQCGYITKIGTSARGQAASVLSSAKLITPPERFPNGYGSDCSHLQIELVSNVSVQLATICSTGIENTVNSVSNLQHYSSTGCIVTFNTPQFHLLANVQYPWEQIPGLSKIKSKFLNTITYFSFSKH